MADSIFPSGGLIQSVSVTLTDAQIKALPTTPITLVEAPGAGRVVNFLQARATRVFTTPYTGINTSFSAFAVGYGAEGGFYASNIIVNESGESLSQVTTLLGGAPDRSWVWTQAVNVNADPPLYPPWPVLQQISEVDNQPMKLALTQTGDLTGGHASNTLTVHLLYWISDL